MLSGESKRYGGPLRRPARLPPASGSESRAPSPRWGSRLTPCSVSTCHAPYPGERSRLHWSVAPAQSSGLPCFQGRSALTISFRGLLGLHAHCGPSTCRPTHGGPLSRELRRVGYPPHRLGSYWGVPTTPQAGLAPARTQHLHGAPEKGPSASLAPSAARSTYREYASRAAVGRRLATGPF